ncbi:hypothetical protein DL93DRAFT_2114836 [Clavulina sp. PMI_390]|nr:hypothetical protein DL93DRAFT_2114836 [Clavulina sp. PMI_390]
MSLPKMVEFSRIENPLVPPSHQESDEDDLEEIVPLQNGDTATLSSRVGVPLQTPNGTASIGVPKTMSEFAAGRRLEAQAVADEQEDIELQADSDTEPSAPPTPERPTRKTRNASARKPASRSKLANGTPKRGAKRRRKDSEDEDTLSGSSSDAADFKPASTPVRRTARSKKVIAPVPSSDRVLRTRATRKSMAE